jgi:SAM-dependent methyltransferase
MKVGDGRLRTERDFFTGLSLALRRPTGARPADAAVTLRLYEAGRAEPLRESRRALGERGDGGWRIFPFDAIQHSIGREFTYSLDADDAAAVEAIRDAASGGPACRAHFGAELAHLLDPWLGRSGLELPAVPAHLERFLDRHLLECIRLRRYFFLRLAHLAEALGRIPEPVSDALSVGAGVAFQEAFLAGRFPEMRLVATDLDLSPIEFPMPNLIRERLDILQPPEGRQYDLVFSIECLEHIADYRRAFRHQVAMVRPGKYLYLSVPFASVEEQRDPEMRRVAWEEFGHFTPGFTFTDLEELFAENGLELLHASNMFFLDVVLPVRRIVERLAPAELECAAAEIARLLLFDLKSERVPTSRQAEGIRFLGRKRDV